MALTTLIEGLSHTMYIGLKTNYKQNLFEVHPGVIMKNSFLIISCSLISTCVMCVPVETMRTNCFCVMDVMIVSTYSVCCPHCQRYPKETGGVPNVLLR